MNFSLLLIFIIFMPLLGGILNGFFFRKRNVAFCSAIATAAVFIPFIFSLLIFSAHFLNHTEQIRVYLFDWIGISLTDESSFNIPFEYSVDRLSSVLLLIITGIGTLIHIYAAGYMSSEEGAYRFFSYLNLFVFSMLNLVLGANMLVTFLGWEGVGVCSYLLIGYWYSSEANAEAGMKAFVTNRVGDLGFLIAMFLSLSLFQTLDYATIQQKILSLPAIFFEDNSIKITIMGICLLIGVTGKSAQLPLFVWLPDAMAGPTPVSALIHAATMVTSGIYLMTRLNSLLTLSPVVMTTIATVGAATALLAATVGLVQNDIKKVLAYSTVSQLGYMVLACGVGAFQFGVAHLITHAFFKALLFLGAGSVIHALHHEQDLRRMGGLIKHMPVTGLTFVIGTLAIIGFPGFAGFFSKDEILYYSWTGPFGHPVFWAVGALTAACTSFYMVRLTWLVFFGPSRVDHHSMEHLHESPLVMTVPLIILSVFAAISGYISLPHGIAHAIGLEGDNLITKWLAPILAQNERLQVNHGANGSNSASLEWLLMGVSTSLMALMSTFALILYKKGPEGGDRFSNAFDGLYRLLMDKWRIDELYQFTIIEPLKKLGTLFFIFGDQTLIEGFVNEGPRTIQFASGLLSDLQSGMMRSYLKISCVGMLIFAWWVLNYG